MTKTNEQIVDEYSEHPADVPVPIFGEDGLLRVTFVLEVDQSDLPSLSDLEGWRDTLSLEVDAPVSFGSMLVEVESIS